MVNACLAAAGLQFPGYTNGRPRVVKAGRSHLHGNRAGAQEFSGVRSAQNPSYADDGNLNRADRLIDQA